MNRPDPTPTVPDDLLPIVKRIRESYPDWPEHSPPYDAPVGIPHRTTSVLVVLGSILGTPRLKPRRRFIEWLNDNHPIYCQWAIWPQRLEAKCVEIEKNIKKARANMLRQQRRIAAHEEVKVHPNFWEMAQYDYLRALRALTTPGDIS